MCNSNKNIRARMVAALVVIAGCWASSLSAEPSRGQVLAAACAQCHGTDGKSVSGFPSLAGRPAEDMYNDLRERKARPPEGIMDLQARGYTDEQLRLMAEYFASVPAQGE